MHNMILIAGVLLSGLIGVFLLYIAEQYMAQRVPQPEEEPEALSDEREEEETSTLSPNRKRAILIGCLVLCNGAIAAFRDLFYHDITLNTVNLVLLCSVLWTCTLTDLRAKLIPNSVLIYGLLLRCVMLGAEMIVLPQELPLDLLRSVIAAVALFIATILCRLAMPKAVGFGDVKLLTLMGFFLGSDQIWGCVFFAMFTSFIYSAALLITKRANLKTEIPYAPFLFLGTVTAAFLVSP